MSARIRATSMLSASALALAALCLFAVPVAAARPLCPICMPPDKVTVQGRGIAGVPAITDGDVLAALAVTTIPGLDSPTTPAQPVSGPATRSRASTTSAPWDGRAIGRTASTTSATSQARPAAPA